MTAPLQLKARLAAAVRGLGTKTLFKAPRKDEGRSLEVGLNTFFRLSG